jgi:hypothetical protein
MRSNVDRARWNPFSNAVPGAGGTTASASFRYWRKAAVGETSIAAPGWFQIDIEPVRLEMIASLCHFEVDKKPDLHLVHNQSEDDGRRKNAGDDRGRKRRHQYASKRQSADYQEIYNA